MLECHRSGVYEQKHLKENESDMKTIFKGKKALFIATAAVAMMAVTIFSSSYAWFTSQASSATSTASTAKLEITNTTPTAQLFSGEKLLPSTKNWTPASGQVEYTNTGNVNEVLNPHIAFAAIKNGNDFSDLSKFKIKFVWKRLNSDGSVDKVVVDSGNNALPLTKSNVNLVSNVNVAVPVNIADRTLLPGQKARFEAYIQLDSAAGNEYQNVTLNGYLTVDAAQEEHPTN